MSKRPTVKLNAFDRLVSYVSPQLGLRRAAARSTLNFLAGGPSRTGGGTKGTLSNWFTRRLTRFSEARERLAVSDRAEDLAANNPHAASIADSKTINIVGGTGLVPQSRPNFKVLGITEEEAGEIAEQAEFWFDVWSTTADADGEGHFSDIQFQVIRDMVVRGEFTVLPCELGISANRQHSYAVQVLDTRRLRTPRELMADRDVRDGIRLGSNGERLLYYIANPDDGHLTTTLVSNVFEQIPAWNGHRRNFFHGFLKKEAEQVRGISDFAPCIKLFKDYDDYMDFEVVGAILAASFAVFIETPTGDEPGAYTGETAPGDTPSSPRYKEVVPGQIMYGSQAQKPHILKSERPNGSFPIFVETLLRAMGAATGLPYEIVAKDFSKTNYSSARAAFLEAWRVFSLYQQWLVNHFLQPVWEAVFEENWLRGRIRLPKGAPDFYRARAAYCATSWTPPRRGWVDPVKEVASGTEANQNNMLSLADWYAEQGKDWQTELRQIAREKKFLEENGLAPAAGNAFDLRKMAAQPEK